MFNGRVVFLETTGSKPVTDAVFTQFERRFQTRKQENPNLQIIEVSRPAVTRTIFPNGNPEITIGQIVNGLNTDEDSIRDSYAVFVHTQAQPVDSEYLQFQTQLDATFRAKPYRLLLVFLYEPFGRSDTQKYSRTSAMGQSFILGAKKLYDVRDCLLIEPHSLYVKDNLWPPADTVSTMELFANHMIDNIISKVGKKHVALVFPDTGAAYRFEHLIDLLGLAPHQVAFFVKRRYDNTQRIDCSAVIGNVTGKTCILIDDECASSGTIIRIANALSKRRPTGIWFYATHPVLEMDAASESPESWTILIPRLEASPIDHFVFSDTIPIRHKLAGTTKIEIVSSAGLTAEAIWRLIFGQSLSSLRSLAAAREYAC